MKSSCCSAFPAGGRAPEGQAWASGWGDDHKTRRPLAPGTPFVWPWGSRLARCSQTSHLPAPWAARCMRVSRSPRCPRRLLGAACHLCGPAASPVAPVPRPPQARGCTPGRWCPTALRRQARDPACGAGQLQPRGLVCFWGAREQAEVGRGAHVEGLARSWSTLHRTQFGWWSPCVFIFIFHCLYRLILSGAGI